MWHFFMEQSFLRILFVQFEFGESIDYAHCLYRQVDHGEQRAEDISWAAPLMAPCVGGVDYEGGLVLRHTLGGPTFSKRAL